MFYQKLIHLMLHIQVFTGSSKNADCGSGCLLNQVSISSCFLKWKDKVKDFLIVEVGYQLYVYGSKTSIYFCLLLSKVHLEVRIAFFTQLIIVRFCLEN